MEQIKEYYLVEKDNIKTFNKTVNELIDQGWEPLDGPFYREFDKSYCQGMVR